MRDRRFGDDAVSRLDASLDEEYKTDRDDSLYRCSLSSILECGCEELATLASSARRDITETVDEYLKHFRHGFCAVACSAEAEG
jgi:hypothetical protein